MSSSCRHPSVQEGGRGVSCQPHNQAPTISARAAHTHTHTQHTQPRHHPQAPTKAAYAQNFAHCSVRRSAACADLAPWRAESAACSTASSSADGCLVPRRPARCCG